MASSVWSILAEQVIQAVLTVTSISRLDAKLPLYGPATQQGVLAYLVERTKPGAVVENSVSEISSRIALYTWALLSPLFLTWIMGWALLRARERQRQTERERIDDQERAERGRLERSALVERDAAIAARALADSALKGATAGMQDLGHEIASPAQSLRSALEQFKEIAGSNPVGRTLLEKSHLDLMDGYISRISHAAERVRHGLQLQLRHAASIKTHEVIDLAVYMRKRLQAEQVDAGITYELCAPEFGAWVLAEPGTLEEVIGNVLANTARFRNERPVSVALKIDRPLVTLAIRNEGPIIPRGFEERIFESRVSLAPASDATSHGHGLFIARMAMSALGGTIVARNDEEPACTGVTFVITLPMASAVSPD